MKKLLLVTMIATLLLGGCTFNMSSREFAINIEDNDAGVLFSMDVEALLEKTEVVDQTNTPEITPTIPIM